MKHLDYALEYLKRGASVIPVGNGETKKLPMISSWKQYQSRLPTIEEVTQWWTQWPEANIAVVTGKVSGTTVVDVEAEGTIEGFPETETVRTGGGGWHLYYQYHPYTN